MNGPFHIGATGLQAQQRALEVVANNLANVNTVGFKRSEVSFRELVQAAEVRAEHAPPVAVQGATFAGVSLAEPRRVFAPGELRQTGRPLDVAIQGEGFIELLGPAGRTLLWRGGALAVNPDGFLATASGLPLKSMISVPEGATELRVGASGEIGALVDGASVSLGRLDLVKSRDPAGLRAVQEGAFEALDPGLLTSVTPGEEGAGVLVQGAVETSNVQLSEEMIELMLTQRAYAANAQVVQAGDQLMAIANQLRR